MLSTNFKPMRDFPKIRVPYFGVLIIKGSAVTIFGSPIFGNPHEAL